MFRNVIEGLLNSVTSRLFPVVVLVLAALTGLWHLSRPEPVGGQALSLSAWEQPSELRRRLDQDLVYVRERLAERPQLASMDVHRSTEPFWFNLKATAPVAGRAWAVEFPSRHAMEMRCWDEQSGQLMGEANRSMSAGQMEPVRGGFSITMGAERASAQLLCRAAFRGPAKITAASWVAQDLQVAHAQHQKTATMIESGLGLLAVSMALAAAINSSKLYWAFVAWLAVSLRMALLSAGSDFSFFGLPLRPEWLTPIRQWTLCLYYVTTVAVYGQLFKKSLQQIGAHGLLLGQQISTLVIMGLCLVLSYEQILPILWGASGLQFAIALPCIFLIVKRTRSRVAMWYASSLAVALLATFSEILAAAMDQKMLMGGLNSVTAALASALLASAAVAEHMRSDRRKRELAQQTLKAAYNDSPIGLFTVHEGHVIASSNPAFKTMLTHVGLEGALTLSELFEPEVVLAFGALHSAGQASSCDLQARLCQPGGGEYWCAIKASTVDGRYIEGSLQDITERVRATTRLEFLVNHDPADRMPEPAGPVAQVRARPGAAAHARLLRPRPLQADQRPLRSCRRRCRAQAGLRAHSHPAGSA